MKVLKILVFLILSPYLLFLFISRSIRKRSLRRGWDFVSWTWQAYWERL
jgi:hypothetical protein